MRDRERRVCRAKGCDWTWQARPCGEESLLRKARAVVEAL